MNYFEFFNIPIQFLPDEAVIKKAFYKNAKAFHPDFYTLEEEAKQKEILEKSTFNNEAYKTLSNLDTRTKYILELKGSLLAEGQNKILKI